MIRPSTIVRDEKILKLWKRGMEPKEIKVVLNLKSTWVVYKALGRDRRRGTDRRELSRMASDRRTAPI